MWLTWRMCSHYWPSAVPDTGSPPPDTPRHCRNSHSLCWSPPGTTWASGPAWSGTWSSRHLYRQDRGIKRCDRQDSMDGDTSVNLLHNSLQQLLHSIDWKRDPLLDMLSHLLVTPGVRDQNFVVLTLYRAPVVLRTISYGVGNFCAVKCLKHNLETLHFTFYAKKSRNLKILPSCKCCQRTVVGNNRRCREYSRDVNIRFVGNI